MLNKDVPMADLLNRVMFGALLAIVGCGAMVIIAHDWQLLLGSRDQVHALSGQMLTAWTPIVVLNFAILWVRPKWQDTFIMFAGLYGTVFLAVFGFRIYRITGQLDELHYRYWLVLALALLIVVWAPFKYIRARLLAVEQLP